MEQMGLAKESKMNTHKVLWPLRETFTSNTNYLQWRISIELFYVHHDCLYYTVQV